MKRTRTPPTNKPAKKPRLQRENATVGSIQPRRMAVLLSAEKKYNDVTLNQDVNTTPVETALTTFATGDTALQRDGNKVAIMSIDVRLNIQNTAITQSNTCRFVIVQDKQAQAEQCIWGNNTTVADVFDAQTTVARRSVLTASRFKVLMDEVIVLNQESGTGGGQSQAYLRRFIDLSKNPILVQWSGSSATIPMSNALSFLQIGSTAAGVTDATLVGTVRLRFEG